MATKVWQSSTDTDLTRDTTKTWTNSNWQTELNSIPPYSNVTAVSLYVKMWNNVGTGNYELKVNGTKVASGETNIESKAIQKTVDIKSYTNLTGKDSGSLKGNITLRFYAAAIARWYYVNPIKITWTYTEPTFVIKLTAETGGTVSGAGTYTVGKTATIKATPNTGYKFVKWSDGDTNASRSVTVSASNISANVTNLSYTAEFAPLAYTVTANTDGNGTVTGGGTYEYGKSVTLTATPNTGYKFVKWSDGDTNNPRTVTVTGAATYTAQFEPVERVFSVYRGTTEYSVKGYIGTTEVQGYIGTTRVF